MKKDKNIKVTPESRRDFFNKGFFASAGWLAGMIEIPQEDGKKVKMLTPDGKLVEVDESLVKNNSNKKRVKNRDILDWAEAPKTKKDIS